MERVLAADVYDTLELSALAFGGIGRDKFTSEPEAAAYESANEPHATPCCIHGHAQSAEAVFHGEIRDALMAAGITVSENDDALAYGERVTFKTWCKRLNVVRGS